MIEKLTAEQWFYRNFNESVARFGGFVGGGDVAGIPDDVDSVPDAPAESDGGFPGGESLESNEIHEQAKGFVGEDEEVEAEASEEDAEDKAEKRVAKAKADKGADKKVAPVTREPRANARIRELNDRAKAAESRIQEYESYLGRMRDQISNVERGYQAKLAEIEKSHAVSSKELEILRAKAEQAEEAGLSEVDRFQRKILREAEANVGKKYEQRFEEEKRARMQLEQRWAEDKRSREVQSRIDKYSNEADRAVAEMLKGRSPEVVNKLAPKTRTAVLNYAASHNMPIRDAAKELMAWARDFQLSGMKVRSAADKAKTDSAKKIPAALPAGRTPAKGQPKVDAKTAKKRGFGSPLEAMINDNPPGWAQ